MPVNSETYQQWLRIVYEGNLTTKCSCYLESTGVGLTKLQHGVRWLCPWYSHYPCMSFTLIWNSSVRTVRCSVPIPCSDPSARAHLLLLNSFTDCYGVKGTGQDNWTIWWTQECSSSGVDEAQGSHQKYAVSQVLETDKVAFWLHGQNQNYQAWPATVRNFCTATWPTARGGEEWVKGGNWWNLFGVCKSNVHKCIFKSVWEKPIQWLYVFPLSHHPVFQIPILS